MTLIVIPAQAGIACLKRSPSGTRSRIKSGTTQE